jgi:hypothetical protein
MEDIIMDTVEPTEEVVDVPVKKTTKTSKVAKESNDVIVESSIEEAKQEDVNDDGQKVITGPAKKKSAKRSNVHSKDDGVVGSHAADRALGKKTVEVEEKPKKDDSSDKVAVWSKGNIRWTGVGDLSKGYNIVTKEAAEKWLSRGGIRKATPEEVATHYGK